MNLISRTRYLTLLLTASTAILLNTVGCSGPDSNAAFRHNLARGAESLKAGNLDMADGYIASAKSQAQTHQEKRQAESLEMLSKGARSMISGDVTNARQQWAAIRQPQLNLEVRRQAKRVMDVEVPAAPSESYESEVQQ